MAKTTCPISRTEFASDAQPLELGINGQLVAAATKEFSTGSFGWYHNGRVTLKVGGKLVDVQLGLQFTVIGSKELPKLAADTAPETAAA